MAVSYAELDGKRPREFEFAPFRDRDPGPRNRKKTNGNLRRRFLWGYVVGTRIPRPSGGGPQGPVFEVSTGPAPRTGRTESEPADDPGNALSRTSKNDATTPVIPENKAKPFRIGLFRRKTGCSGAGGQTSRVSRLSKIDMNGQGSDSDAKRNDVRNQKGKDGLFAHERPFRPNRNRSRCVALASVRSIICQKTKQKKAAAGRNGSKERKKEK
jgi:hypothetical protein